MARVLLRVDVEPELKHRLSVLAALRGSTISDIVVDAVRFVLRRNAESWKGNSIYKLCAFPVSP